MKKEIFRCLLFAPLVMSTLSWAQETPAPVTNEYGFLSSPSILSGNSIGPDTRFPAATAQAVGAIGSAAVGDGGAIGGPATNLSNIPNVAIQSGGGVFSALFNALPQIMQARRSYTPPINMTDVLKAQSQYN